MALGPNFDSLLFLAFIMQTKKMTTNSAEFEPGLTTPGKNAKKRISNCSSLTHSQKEGNRKNEPLLKSRKDRFLFFLTINNEFKTVEEIMKTKETILITALAIAAAIYALPALADDSNQAEVMAKLEALVDEYINSCDAKSEMLSSRSENIRNSARRSCMKASYCRNNKEELIRDMLDRNIDPKPYKVRLFLSERFSKDSMVNGVAGK
jgi:hypothetical protein